MEGLMERGHDTLVERDRADNDQHDFSASQVPNADLLRYVGDMVEELQVMISRSGCSTLHGLLTLARSEALLQQRARSGNRRTGEQRSG
jgi:hypothetical protein